MTDKKILQLLDGYEGKLIGIPTRVDTNRPPIWDKIQHARDMIPKMRTFLEEGRKEKVFRWLGFLQCVFWMLDIYTVEQLADHSRLSKTDLQEQYPEHSFNQKCLGCAKESLREMRAQMGLEAAGTHVGSCKHAQEFTEASESALPIT